VRHEEDGGRDAEQEPLPGRHSRGRAGGIAAGRIRRVAAGALRSGFRAGSP
jgi:hypothetical protein